MNAIRIGNAPCSWGNLEFDALNQAVDSLQMLDEMAETGYVGTELGNWGLLPTNPSALAEVLETRDLTMIGGFVPVALSDPASHEAGLAEALQTAKLLAGVNDDAVIVLADDNATVPARTQNAGRIGPEHAMSASQWEAFVAGVHRVARGVREATGLRTVFHHHCGGYIETPDELQTLMDRTDPALVGLCLDTGHICYGGGDVVQTAMAFADRLWHVHFKDCSVEIAGTAHERGLDYLAAVEAGVFCELGEGSVDFPGLLGALDAMGYRGWGVVEQDRVGGPGTARDSAARSRHYLRGLGL